MSVDPVQPADPGTVAPAEPATPSGEPEWFCDQCGARFYGPGVCSNAHQPNELKNLADTAAAEQGASGQDTPAEPPASAVDPAVAAGAEVAASPAPSPEPAAAEPAPVETPATTIDSGAWQELKTLFTQLNDVFSKL